MRRYHPASWCCAGQGLQHRHIGRVSVKQSYLVYAHLLHYPQNDPVMGLWQHGGKIGEYTPDGLLLGPEYRTLVEPGKQNPR
jgi:hypothetical protein